MTYTDTQLKQALAKMLPEEVKLKFNNHYFTEYLWDAKQGRMVYGTELLHLCWLVEESLNKVGGGKTSYELALKNLFNSLQTRDHLNYYMTHATWQQRTIALAEVKGVEIV